MCTFDLAVTYPLPAWTKDLDVIGIFIRLVYINHFVAMKLFSAIVYYRPPAGKPVLLKSSVDVSSFGFFQRSSVQEFMLFTSQVLIERTSSGERKTVKEQDYRCHVYVRSDNLGATLIADQEYPQRVAFTFLNKILDQYASDNPRSGGNWTNPTGE
jgi:synaptobrevin family protein YKT6